MHLFYVTDGNHFNFLILASDDAEAIEKFSCQPEVRDALDDGLLDDQTILITKQLPVTRVLDSWDKD